jgi:GntR family transcriptional regulator / MocR family aminotransferase
MLLTLDGKGPRYAQITRALRGMIQEGVLPFDARLPPTRELARDFGCSRNIVLLAYEQLVLEGYLVSRQGAGTFVAPAWPRASGHTKTAAANRAPEVARLSQRGRQSVEVAEHARSVMARRYQGLRIDFMYGLCEPDPRVTVRLRSAFHAALRGGHAFRYGPPAGDPELRQQLADRIRAARGIASTPDQIVVTSGTQQALDICVRLLLDPGDHIVVEDPGYTSAFAVFAAAGAKLIRVPVDEHGLDPSKLPNRGPIRAIYVTPSHQFPTGAVMPAARRHALIDWARRRGAYVIEDDYDGEFRYVGRPIAALAGLEAAGAVIYSGTFAKSLFPSLRLGYLAVPSSLARAVANGKWLCDLSSSGLLQRTLAQLMATGEYDRHIRRMQKRYRERRHVLLSAVKQLLGADATVEGSAAGLHVVVWLPNLPHHRVNAVIESCAARGVGVYSIAGHYHRPLTRAGLVLGYGLTDVAQIQLGIKVLADVYGEAAHLKRRRPGRR